MKEIREFEEKKNEFLQYIDIERNLSDHTQRAYKNDLEQFIAFCKTVQEKEENITIKMCLERFFVHMFHNQIDKSSIARKVSCFRTFEKFLIGQGIDISFKLYRPKLDKKLPVYLTIDEIFHLLDKLEANTLPTRKPFRDKAIFELLYATGIRCSELTNIKLSDIDFNNKVIRIMGKGRKERLVLFGEQAKLRLQKYLQEERPQIQNINEKLFLNNREEGLTSRSVQRIIEMFRKFLQIERKITPHKLRHSFATHMLNQGVDLRVVQELLGHKALSSTEKYTHITTKELSEMCDNFHPINSMKKMSKSKEE